MPRRKAVVFCSASYDIDPKYNEAAREVVRALHAYGWTLVSGGSFRGTMGVIADEMDRLGGDHIGVLPRFMKGLEYPNLTELIWADTMAERKERMAASRCATWARSSNPKSRPPLPARTATAILPSAA